MQRSSSSPTHFSTIFLKHLLRIPEVPLIDHGYSTRRPGAMCSQQGIGDFEDRRLQECAGWTATDTDAAQDRTGVSADPVQLFLWAQHKPRYRQKSVQGATTVMWSDVNQHEEKVASDHKNVQSDRKVQTAKQCLVLKVAVRRYDGLVL